MDFSKFTCKKKFIGQKRHKISNDSHQRILRTNLMEIFCFHQQQVAEGVQRFEQFNHQGTQRFGAGSVLV